MNAVIRPTGFAAALMASAAALAAQPAQPPVSRPVDRKRPAPVVLASAESVQTPVPAGSAQQPVPKRPIGRVTTCRCGDLQPDPETQDQ
jgi:hypothetical protein